MACVTTPAVAGESLGQWATITKVTDGDTVWAMTDGSTKPVQYCLRDFDSPEPTRYKNAGCDAERMLGDIASEAATELLDGKRIWLETDGEKGAYQRDLARIRLEGGQWLGDVMIQRGLAVEWAGKSNDWCGEN